jgi:hypothetical protein
MLHLILRMIQRALDNFKARGEVKRLEIIEG